MLSVYLCLALYITAVSLAAAQRRWICSSDISKYTDLYCHIHGEVKGCFYISTHSEFYSCASFCNDVIHGSLQDEPRCNLYCADYYSTLGGCVLQEETTTRVITVASTSTTGKAVGAAGKAVSAPGKAVGTSDWVIGVSVAGAVLGVALIVLVVCFPRKGKQLMKWLRVHLCRKQPETDPEQPETERLTGSHSLDRVSQRVLHQETGLDGNCGDTNSDYERPVSPRANAANCINNPTQQFDFNTPTEPRDINLDASRPSRGNHQPMTEEPDASDYVPPADPRQ